MSTAPWRSPCAAAALALARKGKPTFPCAPNSKRPLTPRGFYDASADKAVIAARAARFPMANLGMPTGQRSGLLVIDIDCKNGVDGCSTLIAFERTLGALPPTLAASTPNGGTHLFFVVPGAHVPSAVAKIGKSHAPGIDIRAQGAYVVIPPSVIDGRPYAWTKRLAPAELPARWVDALTHRAAATTSIAPTLDASHDVRAVDHWCLRALHYEARSLASAPRGTRNDRLWRAASALGGLVHMGAFTADEMQSVLLRACAQWPQRTPSKDLRTIERGLAFGIANPRHSKRGAQR